MNAPHEILKKKQNKFPTLLYTLITPSDNTLNKCLFEWSTKHINIQVFECGRSMVQHGQHFG